MNIIRNGAFAFLSILLMAGCDEKKENQDQSAAGTQPAQQSAANTAAPEGSSTPAPAEQNAQTEGSNQLNVYNWSDYIGEHTVENFEKATGIKVRYDLYDSNETLEAKLMAGNTGYDIVVPSGPYLGRQIQAGIYQKLDKSKIPNYGNLDPQILKALAAFDPGNQYAVPYFWGTVGIGINVKKIKERMPDAPVDSLDMLMKPEIISKFADCGVTMLDSVNDIGETVLNYLGKDPHTSNPEDYAALEKAMLAIRPNIKYFHSSSYINDLANGEVCLVLGWSGDVFIAAARAEEAKNGVEIEYHIPKEGTLLWSDNMAIPKDAAHVDNAHKFINYLMEPQVAADGVNYVSYASPVVPALPLIDKAISENPSVYPPEEVRKRLFPDAIASPDLERLRTRTWTKIKTGQ